MDIQVNEQTVSAMLDLGFRGHCKFSSEFLQHIPNKISHGSTKMYGIRGTKYEENLFTVPCIQIGPLSFYEPQLHEYRETLKSDSLIVSNHSEISPPEPGMLGWQLFGQTNLLLDLKNSQIAFCDSVATLKKQGYNIEQCMRAPLLLKRGLVEFKAQTSQGPLLCMLDTGASWNIINRDIKEETDAYNVVTYPIFKIHAKSNLGPIAFHPYPIKLPVHVEAILGMEFFEEYCVFLDFYENYIYVWKGTSLN
ncbi:MAG: hypothetical protein KGQ49_06940 [Verrucomicrobia bacterium]|nr:hypothetical protein [Verrucomicrobiota bacterium]